MVLFSSAISSSADHAAGNFCSGIAGRLGVEIIGTVVYDHSSPDDITNIETVRTNSEVRTTVAHHQQWRQVARVLRMRCFFGIIMPAGFRKILSGAAVTFMNMQGEETRFIVFW